jgi:hypothetical protein
LKRITVKGLLKAYSGHGIKFKGIKIKTAGNYTYKVKMTATMNPKRVVTLKRARLQKPDIEL